MTDLQRFVFSFFNVEVMGRYRVPAIRMSPAALKHELAQEVQRGGAL